MKYSLVNHFKCSLTALLSVFALTACDAPAPKVPHVEYQTVSHALIFEKNKKSLSHNEYESLENFVHTLPVGALSYVGLVADDTDTVQVARAKRVRNYLVKKGVKAEVIHLQPVNGKQSDTILLNVEMAIGLPPKSCPDWSSNPVVNYNNTTFSNFGCAYNSNLITQLSDPADYDRGEGDVAISGARDSVTMQKYYSATVTTGTISSSSSSSSAGASGSPQ